MASGTPRPSQIRWRLLPRLTRSVGFRTCLVTAMHRADGATVHDRSRPINLIVSSEPIQQREVNEIPHAPSLPIAQAAPTRHPQPAAEFLREHLPGMPLRRTNKMPMRHARSETRGRPPLADEVELARTVQQDPTTDREAAPRPYPVTLLRRRESRFRQFCYVL
jgi:hypothetical protein